MSGWCKAIDSTRALQEFTKCSPKEGDGRPNDWEFTCKFNHCHPLENDEKTGVPTIMPHDCIHLCAEGHKKLAKNGIFLVQPCCRKVSDYSRSFIL